MSLSTQWNLSAPLSLLRSSLGSKNRARVERDIIECRQHIQLRMDTRPKLDYCFHSILELDEHLFGMQSAMSMASLNGIQESEIGPGRNWVLDQCTQLASLVDDFSARLVDSSTALPSDIQQWLNSLMIGRAIDAQPGYRQIAEHWNAEPAILSKRSEIDPGRVALRQRLADNHISAADTALRHTHIDESQAYFASILDRNGLSFATLDEVRELEVAPFKGIAFGFEAALDLLLDSLASLHPMCRDEALSLRNQGRLRRAEPDLCLDTPFGSYVQLNFDDDLDSAVRLAHEVGHAIHQRLHRESKESFLPLTDVDSETWAMALENRFLGTLASRKPEWTKAIRAFRQSRCIEMNHRHRMLHDFEQALHDRNIRSKTDINRLWLQTNHRFYGERVILDRDFESAWSDVHHLFNVPFYLSVYAVAKERADRCDLTRLIHTYRSKKETDPPCFAHA